MHFDKRLAEQYKYMSKTEKEMLWQQDRNEQLQALQVDQKWLLSSSVYLEAVRSHKMIVAKLQGMKIGDHRRLTVAVSVQERT